MLVPITEQVFVPIHRIERISFFGTNATVKFIDTRDVERIEGQDAQRLMMFVNKVLAKQTEQTVAIERDERKKR